MRPVTVFLIALISIIAFSCEEKKEMITEKIQYDVNVVSPNPDYDWWIQNLPGPQRDNLVDMIIDGAESGKFKAYDYFNKPLSKRELGIIRSDTVYVTLMETEPPYEEYDTMIVRTILKEDIKRLRFLEEWQINPDNLAITKRILGIAPIASTKDFDGNERWQPLFWIYTDPEYAKKMGE